MTCRRCVGSVFRRRGGVAADFCRGGALFGAASDGEEEDGAEGEEKHALRRRENLGEGSGQWVQLLMGRGKIPRECIDRGFPLYYNEVVS